MMVCSVLLLLCSFPVTARVSTLAGCDKKDPISFPLAINQENSSLWYDAMKEEIEPMIKNKVWELVTLTNGVSPVGCKWIYNTKRDSLGDVERYKARLVAKGFTQREGIDYHETFSPVSKKDSIRIIMALVAHFDLELHQMDVKMTFLNGDLAEDVYMCQPEGFVNPNNNKLVCKLNKSIYGLKHASPQWNAKFHNVVSLFDFVENIVDQCTLLKVGGSKYIFLVLYMDDILLASNNSGMLHETKKFLAQNFDMKDMGEASYVISIEIH